MMYAAKGSFLLEQKLNQARRRMFLFTDDATPPTSESTLISAIDTMNKARSFSGNVNASNKMLTSRAAGWKTNKLYFAIATTNYAGAPPNIPGGNVSITGSEVFRRFYSIGALSTGSGIAEAGSHLDVNTSDDNGFAPTAVMLMPAFDGTDVGLALYNTLDSGYSPSSSQSGSTSTYSWTSSITSQMNTLALTSKDLNGTSVLTGSNTGVGNGSAGAELSLNLASLYGPRILSSYRTSVYGQNNFTGGGWNYQTTYFAGPMTSIVQSDVNRMYGKLTKADTPNYAITWGMMPVATEEGRAIVQIARASTDFVQNGQTVVATKPDITVSAITDIVIPKSFLI